MIESNDDESQYPIANADVPGPMRRCIQLGYPIIHSFIAHTLNERGTCRTHCLPAARSGWPSCILSLIIRGAWMRCLHHIFHSVRRTPARLSPVRITCLRACNAARAPPAPRLLVCHSTMSVSRSRALPVRRMCSRT